MKCGKSVKCGKSGEISPGLIRGFYLRIETGDFDDNLKDRNKWDYLLELSLVYRYRDFTIATPI